VCLEFVDKIPEPDPSTFLRTPTLELIRSWPESLTEKGERFPSDLQSFGGGHHSVGPKPLVSSISAVPCVTQVICPIQKGVDRSEDAAATAVGPARGRSARDCAGDLLYSVERLPMVSLVEGAPAILVLSTFKDSFQPWALAHSLATLNAGTIET
jgi:hypothetical protein